MALTALKGVKKTKKKSFKRRKISGASGAPLDNYKKHTNYFHFEVDAKEASAITKSYLKQTLSKEDYRIVNKLPEYHFVFRHVAAYCHWISQGLDPDPSSHIWHKNNFSKLLDVARPLAEVEKKEIEKKNIKNVYVPNIQERIRDAAGEIIGQLEGIVDDFIDNPKTFKMPDIVKKIRALNVNQAHTRHIINFYKGSFEEFNLLMNPVKLSAKATEREKDLADQFKEGYAHLSKAEIKKGYELYRGIIGACEMIVTQSKATRKTRKPAIKSSVKVVAKLKYLVSDEKYKVASVNPVEVVGATELWVFNIKTRKLGKYIAQEHSTLSVKGTTILYYDESSSIAKTLRKPEEQLSSFNKASKVQLRKFLTDINSVEIKLNGRINADTILLKAVK
jgi:hypothetical protein